MFVVASRTPLVSLLHRPELEPEAVLIRGQPGRAKQGPAKAVMDGHVPPLEPDDPVPGELIGRRQGLGPRPASWAVEQERVGAEVIGRGQILRILNPEAD